MGTSRSAAQLDLKIQKMRGDLSKAAQVGERKGAQIIQNGVRTRLRAATGGDMRLSGMSRNGRARGVMDVKRKFGTGGTFVYVTGPAQLVENDVSKHYVVSKYAKGAQRISSKTGRKLRSTRQSRIASVAFGQGAEGGGRRAVLNLGGGQFRRWTVAYSKGRHPWRDGVRIFRGTAVEAMRKEGLKSMDVFR